MAKGRQAKLQSQAAPQRFAQAELIRWALLLIVPILALSPLFHADFTTWDDYDTVAKNPAMLAPTPETIGGFWTNLPKPAGDIYIPVTNTAWSLLAQTARLDAPDANGIVLSAAYFHLASIVFHIVSVLLVYLILRQLMIDAWPATLGGLLFAIHPVQVETVAWVSGLKDVLCGMFCLVALYAFVRFVKGSGQVRWAWYAAGLVSFELSMLSKAAGVATPVLAAVLGGAAIALDRRAGSRASHFVGSAMRTISSKTKGTVRSADPTKTTPNDFHRERTSYFKSVLIPLIPWFLATLPIIWEGHRVQPAPLVDRLPLWLRPLVAGDSLGFYLRQLLLPLHLAPDYGRMPAMVVHDSRIYWIWIVPIALLFGAVVLRKSSPMFLAAVLLFFLAPLPVLGFVPFEFQIYSTVADHYEYVAMLGAALFAAALLDRSWNRTIAVLAGVLLLTLGARTFFQAAYWQDTTSLFEHTLAVNPNSYVSHGQLGMVMAAEGNNDEAVKHYAAAVALKPNDFKSNFNWGNLLLRQGNLHAAAEHYAIALKTAQHNISLHNNYGVTLARLKRFDAAGHEFEAVLREDPTNEDAAKNLEKMQEFGERQR